jgi:hypothetical protein
VTLIVVERSDSWMARPQNQKGASFPGRITPALLDRGRYLISALQNKIVAAIEKPNAALNSSQYNTVSIRSSV